jgi:hypothetical protein
MKHYIRVNQKYYQIYFVFRKNRQLQSFKIQCNLVVKNSLESAKMVVITVIHFNREHFNKIFSFGLKTGLYFVRYKREFFFTFMIKTENNCNKRTRF